MEVSRLIRDFVLLLSTNYIIDFSIIMSPPTPPPHPFGLGDIIVFLSIRLSVTN